MAADIWSAISVKNKPPVQACTGASKQFSKRTIYVYTYDDVVVQYYVTYSHYP